MEEVESLLPSKKSDSSKSSRVGDALDDDCESAPSSGVEIAGLYGGIDNGVFVGCIARMLTCNSAMLVLFGCDKRLQEFS